MRRIRSWLAARCPLLAASLLFLLAATASAWNIPARLGGGVAGGGGGCGYEIQETFDSTNACGDGSHTNCVHSWTAVGAGIAVNYDGNTPTIPDSGNYVDINEDSGSGAKYIHTAINATGAISLFGKFRHGYSMLMTSGDTFPLFGFTDSSTPSTFLCALGVYYDGSMKRIVAQSGGNTSAGGSVSIATGTTYRFWVDYLKNTSCKVYISTSDTKGDEQVVSTGVPNTDAGKVRIGVYNGSGDHDFQMIKADKILTSSGASCVLGNGGALP